MDDNFIKLDFLKPTRIELVYFLSSARDDFYCELAGCREKKWIENSYDSN